MAITYQPLHVVPRCAPAYSGGPEQCPPDFRTRDPWFAGKTANSLLGHLIRLVANYDPNDQTFSRTLCSFQANSWLEIGFAHFSRTRALKFLAEVAQKRPTIAAQAWGKDAAAKLSDGENGTLLKQIKSDFEGRTTFPPGYEWLAAGWAAICRNPAIAQLYTQMWYQRYVSKAIEFMKNRGLQDKATLGLMVRLYNSGKDSIMSDCLVQNPGDEKAARQCAIEKYGRSMPYLSDPVWQGTVSNWPRGSDVSWAGNGAGQQPASPPPRGGAAIEQLPGQSALAGLDKKWLYAGAGILVAGAAWAIYRWTSDD